MAEDEVRTPCKYYFVLSSECICHVDSVHYMQTSDGDVMVPAGPVSRLHDLRGKHEGHGLWEAESCAGLTRSRPHDHGHP